jgi:hypothetical protein
MKVILRDAKLISQLADEMGVILVAVLAGQPVGKKANTTELSRVVP